MAHAAEQIDLPGGVEAEVGLLDAIPGRSKARGLLVGATVAGVRGDARKQVELGVCEQGAGLADPGDRLLQIEIAGQRPLDQGVEFGIAKGAPPGKVRRLGRNQRRVGVGHGDRRLNRGVIDRAHGAGREGKRGRGQKQRAGEGHGCHPHSAAVGAGI